ncbi:branched-chain amino acid transport system permease protein [Thermohydrogenium kirishiense]|nr:branched-chain amino acid transport system permease protein [Thermohydrogenium kirishiense]
MLNNRRIFTIQFFDRITAMRSPSGRLCSFYTFLLKVIFMKTFIEQLINGLSLGSIYALIALGYTMVYGIMKLINFAHGDI